MFLGKNKEISAKLIEQTCQRMWNEGWSPNKGNINLFSTDFGAILTSLIIEKVGGQVIFRSTDNLIDLSIWWEDNKIEAFPFHKMFKRLSSSEGEDIEYFFNQVVRMVK